MINFIKKLQWLVLLPVIVFLCQGCIDRCRTDELPILLVEMRFEQAGTYVLRSNLLETRQIMSNELLQLPLALNSDTTVYEFLNMHGRVWRLALAYNRRTNFEDSECGFFMDFTNVRVLPASTFSNVQLQTQDLTWFATVTE